MENNHIVIYIRPFVVKQEINVYQNGECKKQTKCTLDELTNTIITLAKEYNINNIDFAGDGGHIYGLQVKEDLINKYRENPLNITIH